MIPLISVVHAGGEADGSTASSGFLGFIVVFAIALALWFLVRNMTGRLRRMNYAETRRLNDRVGDAPPTGPDAPAEADHLGSTQTPAGPDVPPYQPTDRPGG